MGRQVAVSAYCLLEAHSWYKSSRAETLLSFKACLSVQQPDQEPGGWDGRVLRMCPQFGSTVYGLEKRCVEPLFLGHKPMVCDSPLECSSGNISYTPSRFPVMTDWLEQG